MFPIFALKIKVDENFEDFVFSILKIVQNKKKSTLSDTDLEN